jgi:hypothetical protein
MAPDLLDAKRFDRWSPRGGPLVAEGRTALAEGAAERAARRLDAVLALWQGSALANVPASPMVRAEAEAEAVHERDLVPAASSPA